MFSHFENRITKFSDSLSGDRAALVLLAVATGCLDAYTTRVSLSMENHEQNPILAHFVGPNLTYTILFLKLAAILTAIVLALLTSHWTGKNSQQHKTGWNSRNIVNLFLFGVVLFWMIVVIYNICMIIKIYITI